MPISKWVDQKTMVHLHNGILHSRNKEGAPTLCDSMDGPEEHYAKWNKPVSEGQIWYDLTFNSNLITKRKKEAKYTQRHWNWEQTDSNQRGGGRGYWGEGFFRNNYKGHMEKTKGGRWKQGREVVLVGVGEGSVGGKCRQLQLNNNNFLKNRISERQHTDS